MDTYNPNGQTPAPAAAPADPTVRLDTAEAYPDAHRAAKAVLEQAGWSSGMSDLTVERTVGLILGAALLELERPWRLAVDNARAHAAHLADDRDRLTHLAGELERQRDSARTAYLHVSDVEAQQRQRADALLREREAARNLAVRLEAELSELTHLAGVVLDQTRDAPGDLLDAAVDLETTVLDDRALVHIDALDRLAAHLRQIHGESEDDELLIDAARTALEEANR